MVDNINFILDEGEVCGLVGELGLGKSLIVKVICGVFKDEWFVIVDCFCFNDIELFKLLVI